MHLWHILQVFFALLCCCRLPVSLPCQTAGSELDPTCADGCLCHLLMCWVGSYASTRVLCLLSSADCLRICMYLPTSLPMCPPITGWCAGRGDRRLLLSQPWLKLLVQNPRQVSPSRPNQQQRIKRHYGCCCGICCATYSSSSSSAAAATGSRATGRTPAAAAAVGGCARSACCAARGLHQEQPLPAHQQQQQQGRQ
jgi:hypothetical protein